MAYLLRPDNDQLAEAELDAYHGVPFLVSADWTYLDHQNAFIRERAVGLWSSSGRFRNELTIGERLSENATLAYSHDLKNFTSYLERRRLNWRTLNYQGLIDTYDADMGAGKWSETGKPLAAETINRRMRVACQFLLWAGDRDHRPPFVVPTVPSRRRSSTTRFAFDIVEKRVGKRPLYSSQLRLPTREEIRSFIEEVRCRHGRTRALAIQFIFETGTRRQETSLIRAEQIPDPEYVELDRFGRIAICYGTKGHRTVGDPSLAGKPRALRIRRDFLVELHNYKQLGRKQALRNFEQKNPGQPSPPQFFLDESTGRPLSSQAIYRAWKTNSNNPVSKRSPHSGRHCFACYLLLDIIAAEAENLGLSKGYPQSHLRTRVDDVITTHIRPVLGHVSETTTERYLDWVIDQLWVVPARVNYSRHLDEA
ncbi:tyrosine-type recombinase/integrase [Croceibacterium mercuriale]|uniref:tyrosine-type recombinase/integrase n=1 Tax=Croceibacterium mercuriale TaxID=1572751 RepID=UPI001269986E|nr:site-specific integrase [Croceibacterium mercuriale]